MRHIAVHHADVDFVVSTGDLVDKGSDAEYRYFRERLGLRETSAPPGPQRASMEGLREMPMYFLPGNHDPRAAFFRNMFPHAALPSLNVTFERSGIQFICLDWGEQNKAIASAGMFDCLERALRRDVPSIVWMHHAVVPIGAPRIDSFLPDDVDRFVERIQGHSILGIFCGHTHATYTSELAGVPVYGLRSTTYSFAEAGDEFLMVLRPPQYRVVTVERGKLTTESVDVSL
jgi:3',5'-cyclic-AMP phosphodiesterase